MANHLIVTSETALALSEQLKTEEILKPLQKEILLFETYIAGTMYIEDESLIDALNLGEKLTLKREPQNAFDEKAIRVDNKDGKKLGYVPEKDNLVFSRLMDAGKMLYAEVVKVREKIGYTQVDIEIYLMDF